MVAPAKWRRKSGAFPSFGRIGDDPQFPIKVEIVEEKLSWDPKPIPGRSSL